MSAGGLENLKVCFKIDSDLTKGQTKISNTEEKYHEKR